jgi:hypothetical protein
VSRNAALIAAAEIISRSVPDLAHLIELLDRAGAARLAAALRARSGTPAALQGSPKIDVELWESGRLR